MEQARVESMWPDPPLRPQTDDEYEDVLRLHVIPALGRLRLHSETRPWSRAGSTR